jgi:hypothetical protein
MAVSRKIKPAGIADIEAASMETMMLHLHHGINQDTNCSSMRSTLDSHINVREK